MKKEKRLGKETLINYCLANGYYKDKWGNLKNSNPDYRLKLNPNKVRYEKNTGAGWIRIFSCLYSDISIENNVLKFNNKEN